MKNAITSSEIDTSNPEDLVEKFEKEADRFGIPRQGHNKNPRVGGVAVDQLKSIIGRVEKLSEEKDGIAADIRDVFAEAKGNGLDVKAIRQIIKLRSMDAAAREEAETVLDTYMRALGMTPDLFDGEEAA